MTSAEVRSHLVGTLGLDLIGPDRGSELLNEVLPQSPSRWYLTGFLVPIDADEDQKADETAGEGVDALDTGGGTDDDNTPEPAAARRAFFPSSLGLSLLVPKGARELHVTVRWGDYRPRTPNPGTAQPTLFDPANPHRFKGNSLTRGKSRGSSAGSGSNR